MILFPAHEVNVMWIHNADVWRRNPGGGRVLCKEYVPSRHIRLSGLTLSLWLVNSVSVMCDMNRWPSGRVSASAFCVYWFNLQWWRSRYALPMRPNKVETAVQCSVCRMSVFAGFSSHDNSNIYIYIYATVVSILLHGCTIWTLTKQMEKTQEYCEKCWTSPGGNTPQSSSNTATFHPSRKLLKRNQTCRTLLEK